MSKLLSIRTNILYTKEGVEFKKHNELVFLISEKKYSFSNESEVVKETLIKEVRFT